MGSSCGTCGSILYLKVSVNVIKVKFIRISTIPILHSSSIHSCRYKDIRHTYILVRLLHSTVRVKIMFTDGIKKKSECLSLCRVAEFPTRLPGFDFEAISDVLQYLP